MQGIALHETSTADGSTAVADVTASQRLTGDMPSRTASGGELMNIDVAQTQVAAFPFSTPARFKQDNQAEWIRCVGGLHTTTAVTQWLAISGDRKRARARQFSGGRERVLEQRPAKAVVHRWIAGLFRL